MEVTEKMQQLTHTESEITKNRAAFLALAQSICQLRKSIHETERKCSAIEKKLDEATTSFLRLKIEEAAAKKQVQRLSTSVQNKIKLLEKHNQDLDAAQNHVWREYKRAIANLQDRMKQQKELNEYALKEIREFGVRKQEEMAKRKADIVMTAENEVMSKFKFFQEQKLDVLLNCYKYLQENM